VLSPQKLAWPETQKARRRAPPRQGLTPHRGQRVLAAGWTDSKDTGGACEAEEDLEHHGRHPLPLLARRH
jgi:hypothetical protein